MQNKLHILKLYSFYFSAVVLLLLSVGLSTIFATTYVNQGTDYLNRQIVWILLGIVAIIGVAYVPAKYYTKFSKNFLLIITAMLLYLALANFVNSLTNVHLPLVHFAKGAGRWFGIGSISLQPAEMGKVAIILFLSTYYGTRPSEKIASKREGFLIPGCLCGLLLVSILLGKALSNTIISGLIAGVIMYLAGVKCRYLVPTAFLALLLGCFCILAVPYRRQRIINYITQSKSEIEIIREKLTPNNIQITRSICAIGSGGCFGLGLGHGRLQSTKIPESQTDFIFAVIGEELGLLGLSFCILLYLCFLVFSFLIARITTEGRGRLICMAVGFFIPFQAMFNLLVVCGVFPTTGVTAPFISYGGSSLLSVCICTGLVLNVCRSTYRDLKNNANLTPMLQNTMESTFSIKNA